MGINSIKENLKIYYNTEADLRDNSVKSEWKIKVRDEFLDLIKQESKKTLLEIGAGAGYDSRFFMDNGLTVTAVDLSVEMVKKCRDKCIEAYELDFYLLSSLNKKFDCVWAMNTILHVPKSDLGHVLNEINSVLNDDGLFYMGVYGGHDSEREHVKSEVSDAPRLYSSYSENRLKEMLEKHFQIIDFKQFDVGRGIEEDIFQSAIMKKK